MYLDDIRITMIERINENPSIGKECFNYGISLIDSRGEINFREICDQLIKTYSHMYTENDKHGMYGFLYVVELLVGKRKCNSFLEWISKRRIVGYNVEK